MNNAIFYVHFLYQFSCFVVILSILMPILTSKYFNNCFLDHLFSIFGLSIFNVSLFFLTDPNEVDLSSSPSPRTRNNSTTKYPAGYPTSPPLSPQASGDFVFRDPHILNLGLAISEAGTKDSSKGSRTRSNKAEPQPIKNKKSVSNRKGFVMKK